MDNDSIINHPQHYNALTSFCKECRATIECIDVVRNLNFNLGNAIKYIWRCDFKRDSVEDLRKAVWYLNDEISRRENIFKKSVMKDSY